MSLVDEFYENSFLKTQENYIKKLEYKKKTVYKTIRSPDMKYQVQSDSSGIILIWSVEKTLKNLDQIYTTNSFKAHNGAIYSLVFIEKNEKILLVSLGIEGMKIWNWNELLSGEISNIKPIDTIFCDKYEVFNTGCFDEKNSQMYIGSSDGDMYIYDVENSKLSQKKSQKKEILTMNFTESFVLTGGNESMIRLWDIKNNKIEKYIYPFEGKVKDKMEENNQTTSSWVSTISFDSTRNYFVCGGGSTYSTLWSLTSLTMASILPTSSFTNDSLFIDDKIITAGNERFIYLWEKNGKYSNRIDSGLSQIFSISCKQKNV
eukprot:gene4318-7674_t